MNTDLHLPPDVEAKLRSSQSATKYHMSLTIQVLTNMLGTSDSMKLALSGKLELSSEDNISSIQRYIEQSMLIADLIMKNYGMQVNRPNSPLNK